MEDRGWKTDDGVRRRAAFVFLHPPSSLLYWLSFLAVAFFTAPAGAQHTRQLRAGFERDVNRYRWVADAQLVQGVAGWEVAVANRFTSDAFILSRDRLSFRDENQLAWRLERPLGSRFEARLRGRGAWFAQSRIASQELYAGLRFRPWSFGWIEPAVGVAMDRRPGVALEAGAPPLRADAGPAYGLRLDLTPPPLDGYLLHLEADGAWQHITPRRGRALRLGGSARRVFETVALTFETGYANYRRDAYQAVSFLNRGTPTDRRSETVEATTSDTLLARIGLEAPLTAGLRVSTTLDLTANNRLIRTLRAPADALFFDTDFNRRAIDAEVGLVYERSGLMLRLAALGGAEVENRRLSNRETLPPAQAAQKGSLLQQADYDQGHVALQAGGRATVGKAVFMFNAASSILRHDTPEANLDDRDELYHNAQLGALFVLSPYLQADVRAFGTYYHTVYLKSARSAENNVQRSLRLRPGLEWKPSAATRFRLGTELRATYTVDDFVLPGRRPSDQSARELRYEGDFEHDFGDGLRLFATGSLSQLHLGRLLWDRFAEIPSDTLRTVSGWVRVETRTVGGLVADVGLRFFIRSDYDRATTVRYAQADDDGTPLYSDDGSPLTATLTRPGREWIEQIGPTCALTLPMRNGSAIRLDGWLNLQRIHQRLYGALPETAAPRIRTAARRGSRTVTPNLALTVLWNL